MDAYRNIVNLLAHAFVHAHDTDMNEMRQRVNNCLTIDNNDTREMWNAMLNEAHENITYEILEISFCINNGLQMTPLLRKRLWEFVYRLTMQQTRSNIQRFEESNQLFYIQTTLYTASRVQQLLQEFQDEELVAGLEDFRFLFQREQQTNPRGRQRSNRQAWTDHITALETILQEYRILRRRAKLVMTRPRNYKFAFIVAHIIDSTGQMILAWATQSMQDALTSIEQIEREGDNIPGQQKRSSRTYADLDDDITAEDEIWPDTD
ncbi:hypothetical protein GUITHDRAFT_149027 [Guillardia theta CCMP2712]|uniref:Uncharacterized protein n=1 Tax=Guillardia theta (strain CCMP2712) TaxID=905079 RepID=L1I709_GUITC|nr:hypothetical protein GUITHDRAFT_149027 [Guillardia theta CCMP2712]EKX31842.1 hypothetical protein GUITHDRAFT_149027 [Guillardia theta CCMP2712]|eukprot:XP_005818822.1 hypothetical protein GUITHDRAFT_149027 [Guillardia theta CCMP2712]